MRFPKMIAFDYGQTLLMEDAFHAFAGNQAILQHSENPNGVTAAEMLQLANALNTDIHGQGDGSVRAQLLEAHCEMFNQYLTEYFGILPQYSPLEMQELFWDVAGPAKETPGIRQFLAFLRENDVRTAVVSNISFSGEVLRRRIERFFPEHPFSFILASSEYIFRKPSHWIFDLALRKAELPPEDIWYCGDNPICDVEGAAGVGIFPVWYRGALENESPTPPVPHLAVESWSELEKYLRALR